MKDVIKEVLREFYTDGMPDEVVARDIPYFFPIVQLQSWQSI